MTMRKSAMWISCAVFAFGFIIALPVFAQPIAIIYPRPESANDSRSAYRVAVLELALSKAKIAYELRPSLSVMQQNRALQQLSDSAEVSVAWSMTTKEREQDLLPVRIPLDKGVLGWRIFLINGNSKGRFEQVQTLEQLRALSACQGHDWPDRQILASNGLKVYGSLNYESLFRMIEFGRVDYFPRSIEEIWREEKEHPNMDLAVEQTIILQYPTAEYFFVNKKNQRLAAALEKGLRAAIADGSFDKLFMKFYGEALHAANIKSRKLFKLTNPLLPEKTPIGEKDLWLNLHEQ